MESAKQDKPIRAQLGPDKIGQLKEVNSPGILGILRDKILVASWVFSYTLILQVFRMLKSAELRNAALQRAKKLNS